MPDRDDSFQALCHEAVLACGADIAAIRRYVATRLGAMDDAGRRLVARDIARVLAFTAPDRPTRVQ